MLKITLYQMRRNIGRLIAAGIAIAIGTAFVAATFVGGQVLIQTAETSMTASLGDADLTSSASYKVTVDEYNEEWLTAPFTPDEVAQITAVPGVAAVNLSGEYDTITLTSGDKNEYTAITQSATNPALQLVKVVSGEAPVSDTDIALPQKSLDRLGLEIGDHTTALITDYTAYDEAMADGASAQEATESATLEVELNVTGVTDDFRGAFTHLNGASVMTGPGWAELAKYQDNTTEYHANRVLIAVDEGADTVAVQGAVGKITDQRPTYTPTQVAENSYQSATGDANIIMTFVLVFAALALFVAGLVITNTFQVLVAQRAKTLALLRCVGANKKQIRNSVLIEAAILGVISSIAGIIAGLGLMQATLAILGQFEFANGIPQWITVPATAIWVPLLAGTAVTVMASLVPARIATKVSPLAALRPQEGSGEATKKAGKVRLVFALLLVLGGAGLIALGLILGGGESSLELSLIAGIFGGMLTFVGLIIGSVMWIPKVVGAFGKLVSVGAATKLASANTLRNPRRTAATATALFIGVTLVAMMSVGAATARETFNSVLDEQFPIDIIGQPGWSLAGPTEITQETVDRVNGIAGVEAAALVDRIEYAAIHSPDKTTAAGTEVSMENWSTFLGISNDDARKVLRTPEIADQYDNNTALMPANVNEVFDGATARIYVPSSNDSDVADVTQSSSFGDGFDITVVKGTSAAYEWFVTPETLAKIVALGAGNADFATNSSLIIKVADINSAGDVVDQLRDAFDEDAMYFTGAVMERLQFQQTIDIILLVLVGLLAVAVVIALIGVANTLSLSVIERRRESATLRAIGMSKKQLKRSLGVEGMLIAGIGALLGVALGILYAYIGANLLLGGFAEVKLSVRWVDLVVILVVALLAGLLASVLPARGAAKTSPVEALAMD